MDEIRAPNYELALLAYQTGMKYKDIAEKYGVTINPVKSWKTRYQWSKDKKKSVHTKSEKVCIQKGGQPGNKNAVGNKGGAAPKENKNAVKAGEFETLFFNALEEDEKQLIGMIQLDKEQLLLQEIQLLTIRERRMLKRIEDIKRAAANQEEEETAGMIAVKYKSGTEKDKWMDLTEYIGALGQIQAVEDALTRVQARKQKAIDSLHRYGFDDAGLELEIMKVEIETLKRDPSDQEIEHDGFMAAMNEGAAEIYGDADD